MGAQILTWLAPTIAGTFALLFSVLWWRDRSQLHIAGYAVCFGMLMLGVMLTFAWLGEPGPLPVLAVHFIYSAGATGLIWGMARRVGQRVVVPVYMAICTSAAVPIYFAASVDNQTVQMAAANGAMGLLFALGGQLLYRTTPRSIVDRFGAWVVMLIAAQFFWRPLIVMLVEGQLTAETYRQSIFYSVFVVTVALLALLLALALVASIFVDELRADQEEADIDPLSGLLLRGTFENDGLKMFAKACKKGLPVSLIVADIDHFKQVNDRHGHTAGDEAIAGFAALINDAIRSIDIAGRVGGEEFAILVWNCEAEPAVGLAERLRRGLSSRPIRAGASELRLTASFGVAQWQDGESYAQVFNRADAALYQAKNSGRDRVCSGARVSNSQSGAQESPLPLSGKQTPALSAKQTPVSSAKQTPALSAKQTGALSGKQKPVDNVVVLRG